MERTITDSTVLDCGHVPSPHSASTTGYGKRTDGTLHCFACCDAFERESLRTEQTALAYLNQDGSAVTTWTGGHLMRVTSETVRRVGFGHNPQRTYLQATDIHGQRWHGNGPGHCMYVRMRRCAS
jgi:hypothetical protein